MKLNIAYDQDGEVSKDHSKLIEKIIQLDKSQKIKKAERNEPTLQISEFHLVKSGVSDKDTVLVRDLAKSLGKKGHHAELTKSLNAVRKKAKVLRKPLEKPAADKIKRIVGFENTQKEISKWNAIIARNRTVDKIKFPLNSPSMRLQPSDEFVKKFRIQSELEKELAELEPQKENVETAKSNYTMTLDEIMVKRKEVARFRAQQSYKEAKAHRQRKIKSKKFHRIQGKERIKLQIKEFEQLQKIDPQVALEKLEQLDKTRAEERMSLRHKSTGQWAKSKQIRAKYNRETRQELAQQLSINRELTQKIKNVVDSDEEKHKNNVPPQISVEDEENPWINNRKTASEIDEFVKSYRKYWDTQHSNSEKKIFPIGNGSNEDKRDALQNKYNNDKNPDIVNESLADISNNIIDKEGDIEQSLTQSNEQNKKKSKKIVHKFDGRRNTNSLKTANETALTITFTSAWEVDSVESMQNRGMFQSCKTSSKVMKIKNLFNNMEEHVQHQFQVKLNRVKEEYNTVSKSNSNKSDNCISTGEDDTEKLYFKADKHKPILNAPLSENISRNADEVTTVKLPTCIEGYVDYKEGAKKLETDIDPNKYINAKPQHLKTHLPDIVTASDDAEDVNENEEDKRMTITEAFADDDVIEQFRKEKDEEVKKSKPEDMDLNLPGWGAWGGKCIKPSSRKKKRFIIEFPKDAPRKDQNKGDVIIFEGNNKELKKHQVNELLFPFTSVKDFEASIRAPLGRNFIPENAHKKLIEPSVQTLLGTVIEPMDEDVLVNMKKTKKNFPGNTNKSKRSRQ
ncbi:hypothetical protein KM043_015939 [Ampulex compressa]|nr:hypothetical protein KM043_015939 [Ampulex compressa]